MDSIMTVIVCNYDSDRDRGVVSDHGIAKSYLGKHIYHI